MRHGTNISVGEYYHVYNRGVEKRNIFLNQRDYTRFLLLVFSYQSDMPLITNLTRAVQRRGLNMLPDIRKEILENKSAELVNFCLMPNHFHLTLHEIKEGGISHYMQRVQNAYTKYFNAKRERSGHLFQGPFQATHVEDNEQLLYLSTYIHRNPIELKNWKNKLGTYPWSSLQDYVHTNRWKGLLYTEIILEQFPDNQYKKFIEESPAKQDEFGKGVLIDDDN